MFKIKIAGINVLVKNKYKYTRYLCADYITEEEHTDFEVCVNDKSISEEIKCSEIETNAAYAESVCVHREIAERLAEYDAFLLHSALIECDGVGVAFAARSGVGKSTHVGLWKKNFGERVKIINGDKPIIRFFDGVPYAFGTPWLGKEGLGENTSCKFSALCFLERGVENKIAEIPAELGAMAMFSQIYIPQNEQNAAKTLELADKFSFAVRFYRLACNMDDEAAVVSHNAIIKR
jgi:hypothetical protein